MKMSNVVTGIVMVGMSLLAGSARADVTEPETKLPFAEAITEGGTSYALAGVGVREKFGFDVYAVGLYLEKGTGAAAAKAAVGGKVDDAARQNMKLFNAILDGKFAKVVHLKMARSVGGPKIKDGFIDSLSKNLDVNGADVKADVEKLTKYLESAEATKGSEYKFTFGADGSLAAKGPGGAFTVTNAKLARGFLGNWIGQNPITTKLRANLAAELAKQ